MKFRLRLKKRLVVVLLAACLGVYFFQESPPHVIRFRLTVDIDTPAGIKSGSSVLESRFHTGKSLWPQGVGLYQTTGEAVFVDLGEDKHVIAILSGGEHGDWQDWHRNLLFNVFRIAQSRAMEWQDMPRLSGSASIEASSQPDLRRYLPSFAIFSDTANPYSARIVAPSVEGFTATFGAGYSFRRFLIEIVPSNTPITTGIGEKLPFLISQREKLRRLITDMPPRFQPHFNHFVRENF